MRDLIVAMFVFGLLPFVLKRPFLGVAMLTVLGYMNPHRLCYGFMFNMPVVMMVAVVTLIGMLISKEVKRIVWSREIIVIVILVVWMGLTTTKAIYFNDAVIQYEKVIKIQILTFMTLVLLTSRERVNWFIWCIVVSIGFYGIKGGLFTIANGGAYRVSGPPDSFIGGNNEVALAMVMTIPLMRYLQLQQKRRLIVLGLTAGMLLTAIAAFGSQSRGALVALICTGVIFLLNSRNKFATALFIMVSAGVGLSIMPEAWFSRMDTINTYQSDASAMGRVNAWWVALRLANDRFFGGGFEAFQSATFRMYAPNPEDARDVHSIYFEMLGEHGWVGLGLFLTLLGFTWMKCGSLIRYGRKHPDALWAKDLGAMIQASLVAYMSAGAFLGLAYFDYGYHLVAVTVVVHYLVTTKVPVSGNADPSGFSAKPGQPLDAVR